MFNNSQYFRTTINIVNFLLIYSFLYLLAFDTIDKRVIERWCRLFVDANIITFIGFKHDSWILLHLNLCMMLILGYENYDSSLISFYIKLTFNIY